MDHAYAITVYKSQGMTIPRVLIADPHASLDDKSFYVSITRGKQEFKLYTTNPVESLYKAQREKTMTKEEIAALISEEREGLRPAVREYLPWSAAFRPMPEEPRPYPSLGPSL